MKKKGGLGVFIFGAFIALSLILKPALFAERLPAIGVFVEAAPVVMPLDKVIATGGIGPFKLTFFVDTGRNIAMNIPKQISVIEDGLIIERDGVTLKKSSSSLTPEQLQKVELALDDGFSTNCTMWVFSHASISGTGIYRVSYSHPWPNKEENVVFKSKTLLLAVVSPKRFKELQKLLSENSSLDRASYEFRNPPFGPEYPKYFRTKPLAEIEKVLKIGDERDKVIFLLGSPDGSAQKTEQGTDWDEYWNYELGPASAYVLEFRKGKIVHLGRAVDSN